MHLYHLVFVQILLKTLLTRLDLGRSLTYGSKKTGQKEQQPGYALTAVKFCDTDVMVVIIYMFEQARQLMNMWRSSVGEESATAQAMVQALRRIPLTKDIVEKINRHCE